MTNTTPAKPLSQVVLTLAGHIDHGKSSLVQALTGGVVDRLPEERRRGMTIDLGFAHFDADGLRFALIDVPGHERFIHTMVAGASGVDMALLVIATDDSVMPQTREHLAVLELLGIRHGVIALTKCDLADAEQLDLVRLEVAELVQSTFLHDAPVICVSSRTGQGIAELRQTLVEIARRLPRTASRQARFRLPIDRVFSPSGQGTVVTGTVWSGSACVGDTLDLLPDGDSVRIRRLQTQGADVETVSVGQRAAINLAGVKVSSICRGKELATPQAFEPGNRHLVQLLMLSEGERRLKHRELVRLHLGANQVTAQVFLEERVVSPGETAFAVLRTADLIVASYRQPFVLRQLSPARTIGGGTVISPALRPAERLVRCLDSAEGLASSDPQTRLAAYIKLRREFECDDRVESRLGLTQAECENVLQKLLEKKVVVRTPGTVSRYVTADRFARLQQQMIKQCQAEAERRRPAWQVPIAPVLNVMSRQASSPVLNMVLDSLTSRGELIRLGDRIGRPAGAELSKRQRTLLEALLADCSGGSGMPPTLKEFGERNACSPRELELLVQVAIDEGRLERLSPEIVVDPALLETLRTSLAEYFQGHATVRVTEVREHWGITRKHAIPIFEYFDRHQVTLRDGDVRTAGPRLRVPLNQAKS